VSQFQIRFPVECISEWARRYPAADDDRVMEIGARAKIAGFYTRDDFLVVARWKSPRPERQKENQPKKNKCAF